jgi:hypothetical protein
MMASKHSKHIRKLRSKWLGEAYERELRRELAKLDASFAAWRGDEIDSWELSDRIHKFHNGASQELYKKYNYGEADVNVAYAIVSGILDRKEVPGELIEALANEIAYFEDAQARGKLAAPGE